MQIFISTNLHDDRNYFEKMLENCVIKTCFKTVNLKKLYCTLIVKNVLSLLKEGNNYIMNDKMIKKPEKLKK